MSAHATQCRFVSLGLFVSLFFFAACASPTTPATQPQGIGAQAVPTDYRYSFAPLPARFDVPSEPASHARVDLGRRLFFDPMLSVGGDISCATCHDLKAYGIDHRPTAIGHLKQVGTRNTPSVYNSAGFVALFWDGRSPTIEEQSKQPILNPIEMAMPNPESVVSRLRASPQYRAEFLTAFPEVGGVITYDNMASAIGAFERGLITPGRFDQYLRGDSVALTTQEEFGFRRFVELGCASCHNGPALGGQTFERLGIVEPYPDRTDLGLAAISQRAADEMKFRVPGLRNVERTPPYFHDGSIASLDEAVTLMAKYQAGIEISQQDLRAVVAFLSALTGEIPLWYVQAPTDTLRGQR